MDDHLAQLRLHQEGVFLSVYAFHLTGQPVAGNAVGVGLRGDALGQATVAFHDDIHADVQIFQRFKAVQRGLLVHVEKNFPAVGLLHHEAVLQHFRKGSFPYHRALVRGVRGSRQAKGGGQGQQQRGDPFVFHHHKSNSFPFWVPLKGRTDGRECSPAALTNFRFWYRGGFSKAVFLTISSFEEAKCTTDDSKSDLFCYK